MHKYDICELYFSNALLNDKEMNHYSYRCYQSFLSDSKKMYSLPQVLPVILYHIIYFFLVPVILNFPSLWPPPHSSLSPTHSPVSLSAPPSERSAVWLLQELWLISGQVPRVCLLLHLIHLLSQLSFSFFNALLSNSTFSNHPLSHLLSCNFSHGRISISLKYVFSCSG